MPRDVLGVVAIVGDTAATQTVGGLEEEEDEEEEEAVGASAIAVASMAETCLVEDV